VQTMRGGSSLRNICRPSDGEHPSIIHRALIYTLHLAFLYATYYNKVKLNSMKVWNVSPAMQISDSDECLKSGLWSCTCQNLRRLGMHKTEPPLHRCGWSIVIYVSFSDDCCPEECTFSHELTCSRDHS
jgi:hypothetical protein